MKFHLCLIVVLAVSIRTTRRELFRLDNQDLLVLIMLLAAPLVVSSETDGETVARAVVRVAIVIYAAEFIISRVPRPRMVMFFCLSAWVILLAKLLI